MGAIGVSMLWSNSAVASEDSEDSAFENPNLQFSDLVAIPSTRGVYRSFETPTDTTMPENLLWLYCYGIELHSTTDAVDSGSLMAHGLWDYHEAIGHKGWDQRALMPTGVRKIGDASSAWSFVEKPAKVGPNWNYTHGILAVVQDRWLQVMWGATKNGNPVKALADFSEKTILRWPNETAETKRDDVNVGGLWEVLPMLVDMPDGISIGLDTSWVGEL